MLQPLRLGPCKTLPAFHLVPPRLQPLIAAVNRGDDVAPIIEAIVRSFGFDGFMYGVSLTFRPNTESRLYFYSTWSVELTRIYDEQSVPEVDPRIQSCMESVSPLAWDQQTYRGQSATVDDWLELMASFGIRSGVVCPIRDMHGRMAMLSLSSGVLRIDPVRRAMIASESGDITLLGLYFHELFVNAVINDLVPPHLHGKKLSRRELQCLNMAAWGLTGDDIAYKLSISLRTVQQHFDSIRSKLGAANRSEAVAMGLEMGIISRDPAAFPDLWVDDGRSIRRRPIAYRLTPPSGLPKRL